MKKNRANRLIVILLIVALIATMVSITGSMFAEAEVGSYYSGITAKSGRELLGQLHDLITSTHKKYTSYDDCSNPYYVKQTDPGSNGNSVMEFYSQADISANWGGGDIGTWNREHVWCKSLSNRLWGTSGGGSDMHHIRPVETALNSTRGSNKFGDANKQNPKYYKDRNKNEVAIGGYLSDGTFEPIDKVKGDVARIVMYVYTHYNTYSNVGGTTNGSGGSFGTLKFTNIIDEGNEESAINLLLEWNKMDPVDDIERTRNEAVYQIQGNRNPFIDNPNYANAIWGGEDMPITKLTGMTMNPSSLELTVDQTKRLSLIATPSDADATSRWASSNENVASVSSTGLVTGVAEGTATITATSVSNSSITASAIVTVKAKSTDDPIGSGYIEITQSSFDMTGGYTFKNWTSGGIGGIAFIYGGNPDAGYPLSDDNGIQFNIGRESYYIASNIATSGPIKSVTVTMVEGKPERLWKLLTSDTAYGEVAGKPTNGNDHGTERISSQGVTWTLDGCTDTYFALTCEEPTTKSAASYISSIVIEYGSDSGDDPKTPTALEITPKTITLDKANATENAIKSAISVNIIYSDNSKSKATSYTIGGFNPSKTGAQTVTITSGSLSGTITVTVNDSGDDPIPPTPDKTIEEFIASVDDIANAETREAKYSAILKAINTYRGLSVSDKSNTTVSEKYEVLQNAVNAYNQEVENINTASEQATENGLLVCLKMFSALSAVLYMITRKLF